VPFSVDSADFSPMASTWLCRDDLDRERLLDMEERIKPVRKVAMGMLALVLVAAGPWIGWWTLAPLAFAALGFHFADGRLSRSERPEYLMFAAWVGSEVMIALAVALTNGPESATLAWLAIPVVTLSARFSSRGVALGVAIAVALTVAVAFSTHASEVLDNPPLVMAPVALIVAIAALSMALMKSDLHHRNASIIDPLTGLLNRKALGHRVAELTEQSRLSGEPVGMIVADIDHFKQHNDTLGHAAGDGMLKDVAYSFHKQLRAFDLAYRIGGEEFLILLPGGDAESCLELAGELREGIASQSFEQGTRLTMSFGVSASPPGTAFDYETVFAAADQALYEAKERGRNLVCQQRPDYGRLTAVKRTLPAAAVEA
jgi:diguanylate cyclase (GGDEF)-like protein